MEIKKEGKFGRYVCYVYIGLSGWEGVWISDQKGDKEKRIWLSRTLFIYMIMIII